MENETFDVARSCQAQAAFVKEKGYPDFAPTHGRCYSCGRNIYTRIESSDGKYFSGYSVERASSGLITGCPHCCRSYCD